MDHSTQKEYKKRIDHVLDHILKNLDKDIHLNELAQIANYSPFHFQKLFKKQMGISPKQYVLKLKLETALHFLIIRPDMNISTVSSDFGFSSPAVFTRAVKNQYGISPEKFRSLRLDHKTGLLKKMHHHEEDRTTDSTKNEIQIEILKIPALQGIYGIASSDKPEEINDVFIRLKNKAESYELPLLSDSWYGIISPHQGNIYKCFLPLKTVDGLSKKFNVTAIKKGTYASFKVTGNQSATLKAAQYFYQKWLPKSGYKIADIIGFETFTEKPVPGKYEETERQLFVPIELD